MIHPAVFICKRAGRMICLMRGFWREREVEFEGKMIDFEIGT
jgi:hypothetical protein